MNTAKTIEALAANPSAADLADLNDCAVCTLREMRGGILAGVNLERLAQEESNRMHAGGRLAGWTEYKRASRAGAAVRLNRRARFALWVLVTTRARLALPV